MASGLHISEWMVSIFICFAKFVDRKHRLLGLIVQMVTGSINYNFSYVGQWENK
jgi:hypothetical protein